MTDTCGRCNVHTFTTINLGTMLKYLKAVHVQQQNGGFILPQILILI